MLPFIHSSYLHTLLECFGAGVVICNVRGDVYAANEAAAHLLGRTRENLLSARLDADTLAGFERPGEVVALLDAARNEHLSPHGEALQARYTHPDLGLRHYTLSCSRLVEYDKIFGLMLHITDVSTIFEMHQRESRMQQERIDSLGQLSLAVAHQIRNPLMSIGGFARLALKREGLPPPVPEFLQHVLDAAHRLEDVVNAVTQYTAVRRPQPRETTLQELLSLAQEGLPAPGEGVRLEYPSQNAPLAADPQMTAEALREVLQNGLEALREHGGTVRVGFHTDEAGCVIEVGDDGPGVSEDARPFLFDPFFTTKAVGVGMGLPKARKWMRDQGGDVKEAPGDGCGARFLLHIAATDGLMPSGK